MSNGARFVQDRARAGATYVQGEEIALRAGESGAAVLRTGTGGRGELRVEAEEEHLLAAFGTPLHPLSLRQKRHGRVRLGDGHGFRKFFNLDDFFFPVLRKKYA